MAKLNRALKREPDAGAISEAIPWRDVDSTCVRRWRYLPDGRLFQVEFVEGGVYEYYNVPDTVAEFFEGSSSYGRAFRALILNVFPYRKIG